MKTIWSLLFVALTACGNQFGDKVATNDPMVATPVTPEAPQGLACVLPKLDFAQAKLDAAVQGQFAENFRLAFDQACGEKLLGSSPLVDPRSADKATLFVTNAPEANIVSIYFDADNQPARTLIEVPFGSPSRAPSVENLHEAIFCAVKGATPKEEEDSGRCLPD